MRRSMVIKIGTHIINVQIGIDLLKLPACYAYGNVKVNNSFY